MNKEEERILTTICMALPYMDDFSKGYLLARRNSSAFGHQTLPDIIPQDQPILKCNYGLYRWESG